MKSSKSCTADYVLLGTILGEQFSLPKIRCEVFLSKVLGEVGYATFKLPSDYDINDSKWPFEFSFSGEQMTVGGKSVAKVIKINNLHRDRSGTQYCGAEVAEVFVRATIWEITLETPLPTSGIVEKNVKGRFLLSPNSLLTPFQWLTPSYTGEVIMERPTKCFSITLADGMNVRFDTYYEYKIGDKQETVLAPYLIAEFEVPDADGSYSPGYQEMDDFMLIASFVARQRSMCVGWEVGASSFKEHHRVVGLSEASEDYSQDDALIFGRSEEEAFLTKAYSIFNSSAYPTLLREAVGGVLGKEKYLLSEFLTLYSSLETLILIFRKEQNLEFIVDDCDALYENVRKAIKDELSGDENKNQRKLLYQNIKGLNRVSFSEAFSKFKEHHKLNLDDLWCVTGGAGSLSSIRNRLVHGNKFEENEFTAVMDAAHHLRLLVERCLLVYLGCNHDEAISATSLRNSEVTERCKESFQKLKSSEGVGS
jgi:hypothetical protein